MTTADYLSLIARIGYAPEHAAILRRQSEAGNASARFAVYGTALRKGLIKRDGPSLATGSIVTCPCGARYNDASAAMRRMHAGH